MVTTLQSSVLGPGLEDPVVVNISATDVQLLHQCQLVSVCILLSVVSYWLSVEETASALCYYWHCWTWHGHIQQCPSQHRIHSYCIQVLLGLLHIEILNLSIIKHNVVIKYWHCFFCYKQVGYKEKKTVVQYFFLWWQLGITQSRWQLANQPHISFFLVTGLTTACSGFVLATICSIMLKFSIAICNRSIRII